MYEYGSKNEHILPKKASKSLTVVLWLFGINVQHKIEEKSIYLKLDICLTGADDIISAC